MIERWVVMDNNRFEGLSKQELFFALLKEIKAAGGQLKVQTYNYAKGKGSFSTFILLRPTRWGNLRIYNEYGRHEKDPLDALFAAWQDKNQEAPTAMDEIEGAYTTFPTYRNGW
jgi:hypothetical protein